MKFISFLQFFVLLTLTCSSFAGGGGGGVIIIDDKDLAPTTNTVGKPTDKPAQGKPVKAEGDLTPLRNYGLSVELELAQDVVVPANSVFSNYFSYGKAVDTNAFDATFTSTFKEETKFDFTIDGGMYHSPLSNIKRTSCYIVIAKRQPFQRVLKKGQKFVPSMNFETLPFEIKNNKIRVDDGARTSISKNTDKSVITHLGDVTKFHGTCTDKFCGSPEDPRASYEFVQHVLAFGFQDADIHAIYCLIGVYQVNDLETNQISITNETPETAESANRLLKPLFNIHGINQ
jgi:hypothetical protein